VRRPVICRCFGGGHEKGNRWRRAGGELGTALQEPPPPFSLGLIRLVTTGHIATLTLYPLALSLQSEVTLLIVVNYLQWFALSISIRSTAIHAAFYDWWAAAL
jgi:hypothetical protein